VLADVGQIEQFLAAKQLALTNAARQTLSSAAASMPSRSRRTPHREECSSSCRTTAPTSSRAGVLEVH
jgi:hypothetical protein